MRAAAGIGLVVALIATAPWALAQDRSLGSFRDWSAMRFGDGEQRACMAFTQPRRSSGSAARRGKAFVFVTHRPGAGEMGRVSIETGYPYREGSTVQVTIGDTRLELRTDGSTAWLRRAEDDRALVAAMRAGIEMRVEGESGDGVRTEDRYSLLGFSAAHDAIGEACR